jgi:hypothetical protein
VTVLIPDTKDRTPQVELRIAPFLIIASFNAMRKPEDEDKHRSMVEILLNRKMFVTEGVAVRSLL